MFFQDVLIFIVLMLILRVTGLGPLLSRLFYSAFPDPAPRNDTPPHSRATPNELDVCYQLLGVSSTAPLAEVEQAFRRKAKKHHPDLGGDEDAMRALNEAYTRIKKSRGK